MIDAVDTGQVRRPRNMFLALAWVLLPVLVTGYQITSKRIADDASLHSRHHWVLPIVMNPRLVVLIALEIGSFAAWMYILARTKLSEAFPLSAISYVFVLMASWVLFGETGSVPQVMGSAAIIIGIWLIGRSSGVDG